MTKCDGCGKRIGLFKKSYQYKYKDENNLKYCEKCDEEWIQEQKKKIIQETTSKEQLIITSGLSASDDLTLSWGIPEDLGNSKVILSVNFGELLNLEKERLGCSKDKLVFVNIGNLAKYYWCAWQYYLKAKKEEFMFFSFYIWEKLETLRGLKQEDIPTKAEDLLKIGVDADFKHSPQSIKESLKTVKKIDPSVLLKDTANEIRKRISETDDNLTKGKLYQKLYGEIYPSSQLKFRYKNFIIYGEPDGITDDFVYEFKYTAKTGYIKHQLIIASCQADLYGVFFQRPNKRIQIFSEEDGKIGTYNNIVNEKKVSDLLEKWVDLTNGKLPIKPLSWKCNKCEFKDECILLKI